MFSDNVINVHLHADTNGQNLVDRGIRILETDASKVAGSVRAVFMRQTSPTTANTVMSKRRALKPSVFSFDHKLENYVYISLTTAIHIRGAGIAAGPVTAMFMRQTNPSADIANQPQQTPARYIVPLLKSPRRLYCALQPILHTISLHRVLKLGANPFADPQHVVKCARTVSPSLHSAPDHVMLPTQPSYSTCVRVLKCARTVSPSLDSAPDHVMLPKQSSYSTCVRVLKCARTVSPSLHSAPDHVMLPTQPSYSTCVQVLKCARTVSPSLHSAPDNVMLPT
ncbi:hypothetical protein J6590_023026 [Homalodisca vitripennis]|nr:hypothetical protein J6590_023026 [Homalodisca vitripennis]